MPMSEESTRRRAALTALSGLAEPTRRAVYNYVVSIGGWVGRDQAATSLGLERGTAAHHLDRLAADGLLDVEFRRLSGRRGPGAGRTAKLYRRSDCTFEVSLPQRDYELAGRLLAAAADTARERDVAIEVAIDGAARRQGRRLAERLLKQSRGSGVAGSRAAVLRVLAEQGYEPCSADDGTVTLRNCPFHQLAKEHTELVCGMNLSLLDALASGVPDGSLTASLEPAEGACCVRLHPTETDPSDPTLRSS
jgi:predicted ArsR family transcriptional regulator